MAMQNIGEGNAADAFYRYKRPKLVARIEGRGNGIKTNVVNNVDLAKALERSPDYILKFFGCELGAQTKFDKATGTSIVNGAHDVGKLDELLEAFTKKYVQCYGCGNPETRIKIRKENIFLACKACGFVSEVDMRHRLNTYILKNPPEDKLSKAEKKLKKMEKERLKEAAGDNLDKEAKEAKKKKKDSKKDGLKSASKGKKNGEGSPTPSAGEDEEEEEEEAEAEEEVVWMTDTSSAAVAARAKEQLTEATAALVTQGNIELEAADQRRREREAKKRAEEEARAEAERQARLKVEEEKRLADEAAKLQLEADKDDAEVEALRKLIASGTPVAVAEAVKKLEAEGGTAGRMRILYEALFGDIGSAKLAGAMAKNNAYLKANALDPASQMAQLVALEHLVSVTLPEKLKEVALALKVLYDEDIADEQFISAWYDKPSAAKVLGVEAKAAKAVRTHAGPFVEWLRSIESDSEEEEDEESDEE